MRKMDENNTQSEKSPINAASAIEAVLFAAGHPITYERLSRAIGIPEYEVKRIVSEMMSEYNADESPRGIMMLMFDDSCQLCTKEEYAPIIREALGITRGGNLSASSMEVLAVIAYNQPCTRAYIDTVRGVDSGYAVSSLCEKELIAKTGRLDVPGRPILYSTTENFLRVFGLSSIDDLPKVAENKDETDTEAVTVEELI